MNKGIQLMSALCVICVICSSCSQAVVYTDNLNEPNIATVTLAKPSNLTGMRNIIKDFEMLHPDIRIKVIDMPTPIDEWHRFFVSTLSGKDDSVDLLWVQDIQIREFVARNYLVELNKYLSLDSEKYLQLALNKFTLNDKLYAVPMSLDMGFLYYRRDLVDSPPSSWEAILELTEQPSMPLLYGFDMENSSMQDMFFGITEIQSAFNGNYKRAFTLYRYILDQNFDKRKEANEFFTTFKSGNALFLRHWNGAWSYLNDETSLVRGKVAVAPLPTTDSNLPATVLGGYGYAINAYSKNISGAVKFLNYVQTDEVMRSMARLYGHMPVVSDLYNDEMVLDANPHFSNLMNIMPFLPLKEKVFINSENCYNTMKIFNDFFTDKIDVDNAVEMMKG